MKMIRFLLFSAALLAVPGAAQAATQGSVQASAATTARDAVVEALSSLKNSSTTRIHSLRKALLTAIEGYYFSDADRGLIIDIITTLVRIAQRKQRTIPYFFTKTGNEVSMIKEIPVSYQKSSERNLKKRQEIIFNTPRTLTFAGSDFLALQQFRRGPKLMLPVCTPAPSLSHPSAAGTLAADHNQEDAVGTEDFDGFLDDLTTDASSRQESTDDDAIEIEGQDNMQAQRRATDKRRKIEFKTYSHLRFEEPDFNCPNPWKKASARKKAIATRIIAAPAPATTSTAAQPTPSATAASAESTPANLCGDAFENLLAGASDYDELLTAFPIERAEVLPVPSPTAKEFLLRELTSTLSNFQEQLDSDRQTRRSPTCQANFLQAINSFIFSSQERALIIEIMSTLIRSAQKNKASLPNFLEETIGGCQTRILCKQDLRFPVKADTKNIIFHTCEPLRIHPSEVPGNFSCQKYGLASNPIEDKDPLDAMAAIVADPSGCVEHTAASMPAPALPYAESYLRAGNYIFVPVPVPAPAPAPGQALPPSHPWFQAEWNSSESSAAWPN